MQQIALAIAIEPNNELIALQPEVRKRLVELMAEAIIAVHRTSEKDPREEDGDDVAGE